jgi:hypothetical protein
MGEKSDMRICMQKKKRKKAQFVLYISQPYQSINQPTSHFLIPSRCLGKEKKDKGVSGGGASKNGTEVFNISVDECCA